MDNLTHTLTGLMLSRAGLNRLTPRASLVLMVAANLPDVDAVSWLEGHARYLDAHRGYTHAWMMMPLMAVLPVVLAWWSLRWRPQREPDVMVWSWWKAWVVSMLGLASHLLLDWTNNYGVRLGLPLEASWHRLDILFIIDPWVWLLLLFGVLGPMLSRLVSLEMGAKRTTGGGSAWFVLVVMCAYVGGRYLLHERAMEVLSARMFDNQNPRRVAAFPVFGNPLRWRAVAELSGGYWVADLDLLDEFNPAEGRVFYQSDALGVIERVKGSEDFQAFLRFNQFPLWRVIPIAEPEGAMRVELFDLRFGDPTAPGFVATAVVEQGRSERESLRFGAPKI